MSSEAKPLVDGEAYLYVDIAGVHEHIARYVAKLETGTTKENCKCEWIVHPDDVDKPEGQRRVRKGEATLDCPAHTKEGFLLGFINYLLSGIGQPAIKLPTIDTDEFIANWKAKYD